MCKRIINKILTLNTMRIECNVRVCVQIAFVFIMSSYIKLCTLVIFQLNLLLFIFDIKRKYYYIFESYAVTKYVLCGGVK
jgi:hypothetical protein